MGQGIQSSRLRWRLAWGGAGGGQERVLDIGAGSVVSVYACSTVAIEALIPEGAHVGRTAETLSGRVIDALIGAEILECGCAPVGSSRGRLTDEVQQGAGATTIDVPPGALRVGIYGDAGDVVRWVVGPPNGDGTLAVLATVTLGASGYVETEVPGLAQGLAFPAGQSRNVAVWRLDL